MNKKLLFASLFLAGTSFGQTLTQANEPAIGASSNMYFCDSSSSVDSYANVTGTGVTWDYSTLRAYDGERRLVSVVAPSTTTQASDFPTATKAVVMENLLTTYWTSTATERTSTGFVYIEPSLGTVIAKYDDDAQLLVNYPFALNNTIADAYEGSLSFTFNGLPMNPDALGKSHSKIDGTGTLKLNGSTTINNVIRYVITDTLNATVDIVLQTIDIQMVKQQYEYYDANGGMPLFIHSTAKIQQQGSSQPISQYRVFLNSVQPDAVLSVEKAEKVNFSIYPNPAKENITVSGNFNNSAARIVDQSGREVMNLSSVTSGQTIQVNELEKGIYFLVLTSNGVSSIEKFSKN